MSSLIKKVNVSYEWRQTRKWGIKIFQIHIMYIFSLEIAHLLANLPEQTFEQFLGYDHK